MMKCSNLLSLMILCAGLCVSSCDSPGTRKKTIEPENQDSTAIAETTPADPGPSNILGIYQGTLPCADCDGIETTLELDNDNTYTLTTIYRGRESASFSREGYYRYNRDQSSLILSDLSNAPNQYLVMSDKLYQLDLAGNQIKGDLAEKYALIRK